MMKNVIAISPLMRSEESGHLLIDDEFYFYYLKSKKNINFTYFTSIYSAERLRNKYPDSVNNISIIPCYKSGIIGMIGLALHLPIPRDAKVIFFGFTEKLVIVWYFLNIFKRFHLNLVLTNNISAGRVRTHARILRLFYWLINPKLERILLHTEFEKNLLNHLSYTAHKRSYVKKHHLMLSKKQRFTPVCNEKISIVFFGPDKPEKPLEPLISLINYDINNRFNFVFHNVNPVSFSSESRINEIPENVFIDNSWKSDYDHQKSLMAADIIILTHTKDFEGKLSGNLCDCIAYGIPFVASNIEPYITYKNNHSEACLIYDFNNKDWAFNFINTLDHKKISSMKRAAILLSETYSLHEVVEDLDRALLI
jgi:hypothetical protein